MRAILLAGICAFGVMSAVMAEVLPGVYPEVLQRRIVAAVAPGAPPILVQLKAYGGGRPVLEGTTNLPDGATLQITVSKPWLPDAQQRLMRGLAACEGDCSGPLPPDDGAGSNSTVRNGSFRSGPFTYSGKALPQGVYPFEILLVTGIMDTKDSYFRKVYVGQLTIRP
jgi:hypothetical protein